MSKNSHEIQLKRCFNDTIKVLQTTIEQLEKSTFSEADLTAMNSINNFTLNIDDDQLLDELKTKIEDILNQHLPYLNDDFRNYIYSLLSEFDYDIEQKQFRNSLSVGILHPLCFSLQGKSESIDGFKAAWSGELSIVKNFVENYPSLKDKPGPWRTTLLYSAARNNHLNLVQYLIKTAKCSVNAPNGQDLNNYLLSNKLTTYDYELRSISASTALHAACFNKHLSIVKYLVEHNGDYYAKNQASETPIMNIRSDDIQTYFKNYLILGYSKTQHILPGISIVDESRPTIDSIWEYKRLNDTKWRSCSSEESTELQKSLIAQPFQTEIHLNQSDQIYTFSTIQFLRSSQNPDEKDNLDWIRCRGSSILNFDCYSIWQIMFIEYPEVDLTINPSLNILELPNANDEIFDIQIHSWYNCDDKMNEQLNHAMNYRQKLLHYHLNFIDEIILIFNLYTFDFQAKQYPIKGYIRWIPKLISNNQQDEIKILDNFQSMINLNPIPLTTQHMMKKSEEISDEFQQDTTITISDSGIYTIDDLNDKNDLTEEEEEEEISDVEMDDHLDTKISISKNEIDDKKSIEELLQNYSDQMIELQKFRDREKLHLQQLQNINELQEDLNAAIIKVTTLSDQLNKIKEQKQKIEQMIKIIQYKNIEKSFLYDILIPKQIFIFQQIQNENKDLNEYLIGKLPKIEFDEQNENFIIQLTGFDEHHRQFKKILKSLLTLSHAKQSAIEFYQRHLRRIIRFINQKLFHVKGEPPPSEIDLVNSATNV